MTKMELVLQTFTLLATCCACMLRVQLLLVVADGQIGNQVGEPCKPLWWKEALCEH